MLTSFVTGKERSFRTKDRSSSSSVASWWALRLGPKQGSMPARHESFSWRSYAMSPILEHFEASRFLGFESKRKIHKEYLTFGITWPWISWFTCENPQIRRLCIFQRLTSPQIRVASHLSNLGLMAYNRQLEEPWRVAWELCFSSTQRRPDYRSSK